jgi:hypothetical protein
MSSMNMQKRKHRTFKEEPAQCGMNEPTPKKAPWARSDPFHFDGRDDERILLK